MANPFNEFTLLARSSPEQAAATIRGALAHHDGDQAATAETLGLGVRTLRRWIARLVDAGHDIPQRAQGRRTLEARKKPAKKPRKIPRSKKSLHAGH